MPATKLTTRQRVEYRLARILAALPPRLQLRLSGRRQVVVDGQRLEPEIQLQLAMIERQGAPPVESQTRPGGRETPRRGPAVAGGRPLPVAGVRDLAVDGATGPLRARHYAPEEPG